MVAHGVRIFAALACSSRMCLCSLVASCYCACSKYKVNCVGQAVQLCSMLHEYVNWHHHPRKKKNASDDVIVLTKSTLRILCSDLCIYPEKRKKSIECCWHDDAPFLHEAAAGHFAGSC